jgi:hypothetical protein
VHHVTLSLTETSWIHHWIVQLFCATDTDRWYPHRFVLSVVGHTRKEITNTQIQAWYMYQYNCFQKGIHKPAVCRTGCCKRVNRYTELALYISKANTCLGWHFQGQHNSPWFLHKNPLGVFYLINHEFCMFYLKCEVSKKDWCRMQTTVCKNWNIKGGGQKFVCLGLHAT